MSTEHQSKSIQTDEVLKKIPPDSIAPAQPKPTAGWYDEAALDRFAEAGRVAWADVPDAAEWVRQLRGHEPERLSPDA